MRRRWIQVKGKGLVEVPLGRQATPRSGPHIIADTPGYQSPVTGLWVEGRKQRREDLKRTGSRPWEGKAAEEKEAARQRNYQDEKFDRGATEAAERAWYSIDPDKRRMLE